jgi:hypothetical protein
VSESLKPGQGKSLATGPIKRSCLYVVKVRGGSRM